MNKRAAFVKTVSRLMDEYDDLVLLLGEISVYAFKDTFEKHPNRCFNCGVTEQGSVGMAAGLAMTGLFPIYHTIDAFMVRRAYEFIRLDFGEQNLPGLFISVGGMNDYTKLGPTHQCREGSLLMGRIPNMTCAYPLAENVGSFIENAVEARILAYVSLEEGHA